MHWANEWYPDCKLLHFIIAFVMTLVRNSQTTLTLSPQGLKYNYPEVLFSCSQSEVFPVHSFNRNCGMNGETVPLNSL